MLIAAMFVLGAIVWPSGPDQIPVNWGLAGQPDRYGGKFEGLMLLPLLALGLYLVMPLVPRIDPMRANYAQFRGVYSILRLSAVTVLALVYGFILLWVQGVELDVTVVIPILVGGLLVVVGNLLGKVRPNWFVGIKTPWTLTSKLSWIKTHRLGGWLLVVMGLAFISMGLTGLAGSAWAQIAFLAVVAVCILWLLVYSYLVWRSDPEKTSEARTQPAER